MRKKWSIGEIDFNTKEDYRAGQRDLKRIKKLVAGINLDNAEEAKELYRILKGQPFLFESEVGAAFRSYLLQQAQKWTGGRAAHKNRQIDSILEQAQEWTGSRAAHRNRQTDSILEQAQERTGSRAAHRNRQTDSILEQAQERTGGRAAHRNRQTDSILEQAQERTDRRIKRDKVSSNRSAYFKAKTVKKKRAAADKKDRKRVCFLAIGMAASIVIILFALYKLFSYDILSYISRKKMEELASCILIPYEGQVSEEHRIADLVASGLYTREEAQKRVQEEAEKTVEGGILYQYSVLYNRNSDMAGWIRIEDTVVNYPVMLTLEEEEYYLKKGFDKKYDINGIPFMDTRCSITEPVTNYLIYGHNMKNGSMFSTLLKYEEEEFYMEHPLIIFDTVYETGIYEIIGAFRTAVAYEEQDVYRYYEFIQAEDEEEYNEYITFVKENSFYETGVTAEYGMQLLTLSTCDRSIEDGRFVVVGRKTDSASLDADYAAEREGVK